MKLCPAIFYLNIVLFATSCITSKNFYFLTDQGLTIWKDPKKGWQEVGDAYLIKEAPDTLTLSAGIGMVVFSPKQGPAFLPTSFEHGDCQVHAEVLLPYNGKAGILLQGRYEVVLSDSALNSDSMPNLETIGAIVPRQKGDDLADGKAPSKNAFKGRGKWQRIDITFRGPRFGENNVKTEFAKIWVKVNGVTVQSGIEMAGPTANSQSKAERLTGNLVFSGKNTGVAFQNVTLRRMNLKRDYLPQ